MYHQAIGTTHVLFSLRSFVDVRIIFSFVVSRVLGSCLSLIYYFLPPTHPPLVSFALRTRTRQQGKKTHTQESMGESCAWGGKRGEGGKGKGEAIALLLGENLQNTKSRRSPSLPTRPPTHPYLHLCVSSRDLMERKILVDFRHVGQVALAELEPKHLVDGGVLVAHDALVLARGNLFGLGEGGKE